MHFSQVFAATLVACAIAAPLPRSPLEGLIARSLTSMVKDIASNGEITSTIKDLAFNLETAGRKVTGSNLGNNAVADSTNAFNVIVDEGASDGSELVGLVARSSTSDAKDIAYNAETLVTSTTGENLVNNVLFDSTDSTTDTVKDVNGVAKKLLAVLA